MNTEPANRHSLPAYLETFPYVNGGLFRTNHPVPLFTRRSRQAIIESGELQWRDINPDIFGSMIQAVITPEHRGGLGMHYTSVPNIMKVIEPLFLNDLQEAFEEAKGNIKKLNSLLQRIWKIKLFDPACGSGNFLIIAYKELRRLEMAIFKEIDRINQFHSNQFSGISLANFFGIELDDFAHEVATLSLWLAEHQMNREFFAAFGRTKPALPLSETGNIVNGNACRLDWEQVCPKMEGDEIYIMGNPPYLGARVLNDDQKSDMKFVFNLKLAGYNDLDYITCWFFKGGLYINKFNSQYAFVSTNSISQGSQVSIIWPIILSNKLEIKFAHLPFKWENNAKGNAGVTCVIIGLRNEESSSKFIISEKFKQATGNINPYLVASRNIYVYGRSKSLSKIPEIKFGSMPNDGGNLILSEEEYNKEIENDPSIKPFLRLLLGAQELIDGINRYSIWIREDELDKANRIKFLSERIQKVKEYRQSSKREATRKLANFPYRFAEIRHVNSESIIIPRHSSERREYIPMKLLTSSTVIADSALAIYNAEAWHFSVVLSKIHMIWIRAVSGRLESRIRYSSEFSYNTFPFPEINLVQTQELEKHVYHILEEREKHSEKTLAQLYDPDKMPEGLREAHHQNDLAVERCYRSRLFESDEERLEYLFKLYELMIEEEKTKGTLFEKKKKSRNH